MISVIGGGPAGSFSAYLLAKEGRDVNVYEEHREIGRPVQCAGIFSNAVSKFVNMDKDFVLNTPDRIRIYSPNNFVEIELLNENYVVDREMFDAYLAEKSMDLGVKYFLGWKFKDFKGKELVFDNGKARTDILVGADGPCSLVARKAGLYYNRKFVAGMQTNILMDCEEDLVQNYVGEGYFGWVIPEDSKRARVGVIAEKNCKEHFNSFLKKLDVKRTDNFISGLVPVYNPDVKICKDNVYLVGDAGMQVKATTYGGVVHGFYGAKELCKSIINKLNYGELCKKSFGRDLKIALMIREKLNKLKNNDYDYLVGLIKQNRVKNVLSKFDRDYAFKIMLSVLVREPRFFKFLFK